MYITNINDTLILETEKGDRQNAGKYIENIHEKAWNQADVDHYIKQEIWKPEKEKKTAQYIARTKRKSELYPSMTSVSNRVG